MTDEQIDARKQARREGEASLRELQAKRAQELRDTLSETEKIPRYIQASELFELLSSSGGIHPVEAKYLALKWNEKEAKRVGLPEQAQFYAQQIKHLAAQMQQIEAQRQLAMKQWEDLNTQLNQLAQQSETEVNQLKQKVNQLQYDLQEAKSSSNRTVIYGTPFFYRNYPIYRPIYVPSPPRPVIKPQPPIIVPPRVQPKQPRNTGVSVGRHK